MATGGSEESPADDFDHVTETEAAYTYTYRPCNDTNIVTVVSYSEESPENDFHKETELEAPCSKAHWPYNDKNIEKTVRLGVDNPENDFPASNEPKAACISAYRHGNDKKTEKPIRLGDGRPKNDFQTEAEPEAACSYAQQPCNDKKTEKTVKLCEDGPENDPTEIVPEMTCTYAYRLNGDKVIKKKVRFSEYLLEDDDLSVAESTDDIVDSAKSIEDIPDDDFPKVSGSDTLFVSDSDTVYASDSDTAFMSDSDVGFASGSLTRFNRFCHPCIDLEIKDAVGFCVDCADWLCDECFEVHTKPRPIRLHVLLDAEEVKISTPPPAADKCIEKCEKHNGKRLQFYCTSHTCLCCSLCVVRSHKTCKVEHIPDICESTHIEDEFKQVTVRLDAVSKESEDIFKVVNKIDALVRLDKVKSVESIRTHINKLKETLDEVGEELEKTCEEKANNETEKLKSIAKNCSVTWKESFKMKTRLENLHNTGQHCNIFVALKRFKDKLATFESQQKDDRLSSSVPMYTFQPNLSLEATIARTKGIGIGTLAEQGSRKKKDYSNVRTRHIADISIKTKGNVTCGITGSTLLPPNRLIVVDFDNKQVKVIDTSTNEMISDYEVDGTPWSVCRAEENFIIVTVYCKLQFLYVDGLGKVSPIKALAFNEECKGVAMLEDRIVMTYINPPKIEIMNTYGKVLQTITDPEIVYSPQYVVVNPRSHLMYISNWGNNTVTCVDRDGKLVATYTKSTMRAPEQAAIDDNGTLFVGGCHSHNVHLVTPDCKKMKVILNETDGLKEVYAVSYCEQTERLYIGMDECDVIKVFQLIFEKK